MTANTMLLNNVTAIDLGFLTPRGVFGASVRLSFLVTGAMDADEQVVVDFSSVKKSIKALIDDKQIGIDHKTVVISTPGSTTIEWEDKQGVQVEGDVRTLPGPEDKVSVTVTNPNDPLSSYGMEAPFNAFVFFNELFPDFVPVGGFEQLVISARRNLAYSELYVRHFVEELLNRELPKLHPNVSDVKVFVPEHTTYPTDIVHAEAMGVSYERRGQFLQERATLRYTHGLPRSTSWGCQNILHGHHSVLSIGMEVPEGGDAATVRAHISDLVRHIRTALHNAYLVANRDLKLELGENGDVATFVVSYASMSRGDFHLRLSGAKGKSKVLALPVDTTVENIARYVWDTYIQPEIEALGLIGVSMYISEGLDKGAFISQD